MRKVTIYSTAGVNGGEFEILSTATTLGEVKEAVGSEKYPWGTSTIADETEKVYYSDDDVIPTVGDFALFVYPKSTKSGAGLPYNGAKRIIQDLRNESSEAYSFFGNYTTKSTAELNELLDAWEEKELQAIEIQEVMDHSLSLDDILNFLRNKDEKVSHYLKYTTNSKISEDINTFFLAPDANQVKYDVLAKKLGFIS
jgi:hypothetical protein